MGHILVFLFIIVKHTVDIFWFIDIIFTRKWSIIHVCWGLSSSCCLWNGAWCGRAGKEEKRGESPFFLFYTINKYHWEIRHHWPGVPNSYCQKAKILVNICSIYSWCQQQPGLWIVFPQRYSWHSPFFVVALLKYNSHPIVFTYLKVYNSLFFSTYRVVQPSASSNFRILHLPK